MRAGTAAVPIPFAAELEEQMIADERLLELRIRQCLGLAAVGAGR
jgi:hypothetical protein